MSKKITELDALTAVATSDVMALVDDIGGTPTTKKATLESLFGGMPKATATKIVAANDTPNAASRSDYQCDGTADNVQIQAAIDALPAAGGRVVLLEGTYQISATIELDDDTLFEGVGESTVLALDNSVDATLLTNANATPGSRDGTGNYRITVRNLRVDGNKDNQGAGADTIWCVGFSTVEDLRIENITVIDGWTAGIRTEFCTYVIVTNCRVDNAGDDGIAINEETYYATVSNNIISDVGGVKTYGSPRGIEVQDGSHDVILTGNSILDCEDGGILIGAHAGKAGPYRVTLVGNSLEGNSIQVYGVAGCTSDIYAVSVVGNTIENNGGSGIIIYSNTEYVSVVGNCIDDAARGIILYDGAHSAVANTVSGCTTAGVEVHATGDGCKVSDNHIADCRIGITNYGDNTLISDNKLENTAGGEAQLYGIYMYAGGDNCRVVGNTATGHITANYADAAAGTEWALNVGGYEGQIYAHSIANVTDPPTDAEIDAIFGTPASVGPGFMGLINDNDADTKFWLCVSMDTFWLYEELTKAT